MSDGGFLTDPQGIESLSFDIIDREAGPHGFDRRQWPVVRRMVHTTGDFDFIGNTRFSTDALERGLAALRRGEGLFCDTSMLLAGINKARLAPFGSRPQCYIGDEEIAREAREKGITRSMAALRRGVEEGCGIYLIGNAPTALFELLLLAREGKVRPSLVVGVPVGFVGAAEAKEELLASGLPHILCRGRKGGSAVAVAVMNALVLLAQGEPE